jgi:hypothetical protein
VNVFERALEIIEDHGWCQRDRIGPSGERCLWQAWYEADAELYAPPQRRWWRKEPSWAETAASRARADAQARALRAAIEEVTGGRLWGHESRWNDSASEEDVRLALKIAARSLEEAKRRDRSSHSC